MQAGYELDLQCHSNYSYYMKTTRLKVARIGNSRGIRFPSATLRRYRIGEAIIMEERSECIVLHPVDPSVEKLSWESTAQEMAAAEELEWEDLTALQQLIMRYYLAHSTGKSWECRDCACLDSEEYHARRSAPFGRQPAQD